MTGTAEGRSSKGNSCLCRKDTTRIFFFSLSVSGEEKYACACVRMGQERQQNEEQLPAACEGTGRMILPALVSPELGWP